MSYWIFSVSCFKPGKHSVDAHKGRECKAPCFLILAISRRWVVIFRLRFPGGYNVRYPLVSWEWMVVGTVLAKIYVPFPYLELNTSHLLHNQAIY
jgi:hypothetical protein